MKRVFLLVLDACGVGAMPDWQEFNDPPNCNTLKNTSIACNGLNLPNLEKLGLANICEMKGLKLQENPQALYGKAFERSKGKDTTTGHWEIAGLILEKAFPVYPTGFPKEIIEEFIKETSCKNIFCNEPASGTEVLKIFGENHLKTAFPIVYTSADSVFQIATHIDKISLEKLYEWCKIARNILKDKNEVARVIARPFAGDSANNFYRISEARKDYAVKPYKKTILSFLQENNYETVSIGKIADIFSKDGIDTIIKGKSNSACLDNLFQSINSPIKSQFVFINLVETDSHFGHRNDFLGFGKALEYIDLKLGECLSNLKEEDLLIITADHGCDPTVAGTDHNREYIPILAYSKLFENIKEKNIGIRESFADISATIVNFLGLDNKWQENNMAGKSFY